jgi:hypothetical protein
MYELWITKKEGKEGRKEGKKVGKKNELISS